MLAALCRAPIQVFCLPTLNSALQQGLTFRRVHDDVELATRPCQCLRPWSAKRGPCEDVTESFHRWYFVIQTHQWIASLVEWLIGCQSEGCRFDVGLSGFNFKSLGMYGKFTTVGAYNRVSTLLLYNSFATKMYRLTLPRYYTLCLTTVR